MLKENKKYASCEEPVVDPVAELVNWEKVFHRQRREADRRHNARDINRAKSGKRNGACRLKQSAHGNLYVCEGRSRKQKRPDARARRREAMEMEGI